MFSASTLFVSMEEKYYYLQTVLLFIKSDRIRSKFMPSPVQSTNSLFDCLFTKFLLRRLQIHISRTWNVYTENES